MFHAMSENLTVLGIYVRKDCNMESVKVRTGKKYAVKVITVPNQKDFISHQDAEMDARASQAVKSAITRAKFCKKPVAKYDSAKKSIYRICRWSNKICRLKKQCFLYWPGPTVLGKAQ